MTEPLHLRRLRALSTHRREDVGERDNGGPLFSVPQRHLSGRTDPATSRAAADRMISSGDLSKGQRFALDAVQSSPGLTAKELGAAMAAELRAVNNYGIPGEPMDAEACRQAIGRRLNELEKAGLIFRRGERDGCACWWSVEQ